VEVKSFLRPSDLEDLSNATGKIVVYQAVLDVFRIHPSLLYLAVPRTAYTGILSEDIGSIIKKHANLRYIVFDEYAEEIILWTD
jgi:hypothetical protein